MKSFLKIFAVGFLAVIFLSGCRTSTVQNVENQHITANKKVTVEQVGDAIVRAGTGLGWVMKKEKPGHIVGSLFLRGHVAVVDITYDTKDYSINYNRSQNLKYNPEDNTIHKNYNSWVTNLNSAIMSQLSAL